MKKQFRCGAIASVLASLMACAGAPPSTQVPAPDLLQQTWWPTSAGTDGVTPEQVFDLAPEVRERMAELRKQHRDPQARMQVLLDEVLSLEKFEYLASTTLPAQATYEKRGGNCLSLSILAVTLARELGLHARVQAVPVSLTWGRDGIVSRLNRHVNVLVAARESDLRTQRGDHAASILVVDFEPQSVSPNVYGNTVLTDEEVLGAFYNNLAADALATREEARAFRLLREASKWAPQDAAIWGNLAVLYRRVEDAPKALTERVARHSLELNAAGLAAKEVLVSVLEARGEFEQARELERELALLRDRDPLTRVRVAQAKWEKGLRREAIQLLEHTLQYAIGYAELHAMLADFYEARGSKEAAQLQRQLAGERLSAGAIRLADAPKMKKRFEGTATTH